MREWWQNVYPKDLEHRRLGVPSETRQLAAERLANRCDCEPPDLHPAFRIYVRLKPEGAPKLYASEANRRAWEVCPEDAAYWQERGKTLCIGYGGPWYVE